MKKKKNNDVIIAFNWVSFARFDFAGIYLRSNGPNLFAIGHII